MGRVLPAGLLAGAVLMAIGAQARAVDADEIKAAIDRGVAGLRRMQRMDGSWPYEKMGATALAGLTLVECGAAPDDRAVQAAAAVVRQRAITETHTYSLSLAILFLDRLGDKDDVPLIESMTVRLLAGQTGTGGWSYECPGVPEAEARRLLDSQRQRGELVGRRELPKGPAKKRTVKDLPKEIQAQLILINRGVAFNPVASGDNSNTQFATIALWVGRRHGLPVDAALKRVDARFRATQNADGGWAYIIPSGSGYASFIPNRGSLATMTCAGVLGIAVGHGVGKADPKKDRVLQKGLLALGGVLDNPADENKGGWRQNVPRVGGTTFYFLWSLERVAVAMDLETIGKKDWYNWGAQILLANQMQDGTWNGNYGAYGADTCFALLFLKRANLTRDLTTRFKDRFGDPAERVLKGGGIGGGKLPGGGKAVKIPSPLDPKGTVTKNGGSRDGGEGGPGRPSLDKPKLPTEEPRDPPARALPDEGTEAGRLAGSLVRASAPEQEAALDKLRESKGTKYTVALATAIPHLTGESKDKARDALAERLTRMKPATLAKYLTDEDAEIRRAAALACAMKEMTEQIPDLIRLLSDREPAVERAAHAALKSLSGEDFGPAAGATRAERASAIAAWQLWWSRKGK